jgi:hypothetical protein
MHGKIYYSISMGILMDTKFSSYSFLKQQLCTSTPVYALEYSVLALLPRHTLVSFGISRGLRLR